MVNNLDEINYSMLKKSLDATAERQKVIAQNIANINTKDYKAWRVVYEDKLQSLLNGNSTSLTTTNSMHINPQENYENANYDLVKDNSTSMRLDGNNVDIDNEMTNLASNTILYNSLVSQANSRIAMRRYVVNEGRK